MSAIIAFSDVHLGYERADSDRFMEFVKSLQDRDDLGDVVIIGDLVDLWRRDVIGLESSALGVSALQSWHSTRVAWDFLARSPVMITIPKGMF